MVVTRVRSLGAAEGPRGRRCAWMKFVGVGWEPTNVVVDVEGVVGEEDVEGGVGWKVMFTKAEGAETLGWS
jgi:hypothetical protein